MKVQVKFYKREGSQTLDITIDGHPGHVKEALKILENYFIGSKGLKQL